MSRNGPKCRKTEKSWRANESPASLPLFFGRVSNLHINKWGRFVLPFVDLNPLIFQLHLQKIRGVSSRDDIAIVAASNELRDHRIVKHNMDSFRVSFDPFARAASEPQVEG